MKDVTNNLSEIGHKRMEDFIQKLINHNLILGAYLEDGNERICVMVTVENTRVPYILMLQEMFYQIVDDPCCELLVFDRLNFCE